VIASDETVLLRATATISPEMGGAYIHHEFTVPDGVHRLVARLSYRKDGICQLYLNIFSPSGHRGTRMMPGAVGDITLELDFGDDHASLGALAGPIESGTWRVLLDLERTHFVSEYELIVEAFTQAPASRTPSSTVFSNNVQNGRPGAGWYRGELHSHSHHSDGRSSVAEVVASARRNGLDFIALTDHFTPAGWAELESLAGPDLCVIRSLELTGHRGHANMHGLSSWVNPFVDDTSGDWTINHAARATRNQNGVFCVNHAFSLDLGWRYHDLDWSLVDAMEVYHHLEAGNNPFQLGLWDERLRTGQRITGVAGTDSHDAGAGRHRLVQVFTAVYAEALEPAAMLEGVRSGRAYITLGPRLEMRATSGHSSAGMGGTVALDGPFTIEATLEHLAFPARVVVLKNGWYETHVDLPARPDGTHELRFQDTAPIPGYVRLEVYALPAQSVGGSGREWPNTLVLSNPIYLEEHRP
jgi:PHP domain